jgi:hypothetical protein
VDATVLADWKLDDLAARADLVVVGTVGSKQMVKVERRVMTETEILVDLTLAGNGGDRIVVSQLGGKDGDTIVEIVGDASLRPGRRYLLFTYAHRDGRRYLVGMALGAWEAPPGDSDRFVQQIDVPVIARDGSLAPAPGPRGISLEDVRLAIARNRR